MDSIITNDNVTILHLVALYGNHHIFKLIIKKVFLLSLKIKFKINNNFQNL